MLFNGLYVQCIYNHGVLCNRFDVLCIMICWMCNSYNTLCNGYDVLYIMICWMCKSYNTLCNGYDVLYIMICWMCNSYNTKPGSNIMRLIMGMGWNIMILMFCLYGVLSRM